MSTPVDPGTLEARRERAVQRAITRACQHPSESAYRLVDLYQGAPAHMFAPRAGEIRAVEGGYEIDRVPVSGPGEAVELLRDRFGLTEAEADVELGIALGW